MAREIIGVGESANDGTGDSIRASFIKVNNMTAELYTDDAGDVNSITAGTGISVNSTTGAVTVTNSLPNATHSGDVTGSGALTIAADAVTYAKMQNLATADRVLGSTSAGVIGEVQIVADMVASNAVTTAKILNDNITHDKLENRFTAVVSVSNRSGATTIDWSTGAVFVMANSLNGAIEFDFTNFKTGQTIDIYNLTGAQTITFDSNAGTSETFNKCGAVDYAGAATNLIQVQCVDDDATAVFNYAVSAYVSDATPS